MLCNVTVNVRRRLFPLNGGQVSPKRSIVEPPEQINSNNIILDSRISPRKSMAFLHYWRQSSLTLSGTANIPDTNSKCFVFQNMGAALK